MTGQIDPKTGIGTVEFLGSVDASYIQKDWSTKDTVDISGIMSVEWGWDGNSNGLLFKSESLNYALNIPEGRCINMTKKSVYTMGVRVERSLYYDDDDVEPVNWTYFYKKQP